MAARKDQQQDTAERDGARARSRGCPYCGGEGLVEVFDPYFDGRRVVRRQAALRGEIKQVAYPMVIAAHCTCEIGRWTRLRHDRDVLDRVPDMEDVLAGRSRYQAEDPTGDDPGRWFQRLPGGGGVARVKGGKVVTGEVIW